MDLMKKLTDIFKGKQPPVRESIYNLPGDPPVYKESKLEKEVREKRERQRAYDEHVAKLERDRKEFERLKREALLERDAKRKREQGALLNAEINMRRMIKIHAAQSFAAYQNKHYSSYFNEGDVAEQELCGYYDVLGRQLRELHSMSVSRMLLIGMHQMPLPSANVRMLDMSGMITSTVNGTTYHYMYNPKFDEPLYYTSGTTTTVRGTVTISGSALTSTTTSPAYTLGGSTTPFVRDPARIVKIASGSIGTMESMKMVTWPKTHKDTLDEIATYMGKAKSSGEYKMYCKGYVDSYRAWEKEELNKGYDLQSNTEHAGYTSIFITARDSLRSTY